MKTLTQSRLKELFDYDSKTGKFIRKTTRGGIPLDKKVGTPNEDGYLQTFIDCRKYRLHRLAWLYVYGKFPLGEIDHKNRKKDDNRIVNLRDVTHTENMQNKSIYSNNSSGFVGVAWHKRIKKWQSRLSVLGEEVHLGYFETKEEAVIARKEFIVCTTFKS